MVLKIQDEKDITFSVKHDFNFQRFVKELEEHPRYKLIGITPEDVDEETLAIFTLKDETDNIKLKIDYNGDVDDYDFELEYKLSVVIPEVDNTTDEELGDLIRRGHGSFESFTKSGREILQEGWGIEHEMRSV